MDVVTQNPLNAEPTWNDLKEPITPHFFKRNHFEIPDARPEVEVCGWRFTLDQLKELPATRHEVTLECAGNGRKFMQPLPPGTAWGWRAVSNAVWTGVSLAELLKLAPPPPGAVELVFQGGDGEYARSLPVEQAYRPEVLVVYAMNDQPLPKDHGGPLRLVVPGSYAMASVKWLTHVRATDTPYQGFYQVEDYQFKPPDGGASRPVDKMMPRAMLVAPTQNQTVTRQTTLSGWAWSGFAPIESVEVVVNHGQARPAQLGEDRGPFAWRAFQLSLDLPVGPHEAYALAHDRSGRRQPYTAPWNMQGYENNSAMTVRFTVA